MGMSKGGILGGNLTVAIFALVLEDALGQWACLCPLACFFQYLFPPI